MSNKHQKHAKFVEPLTSEQMETWSRFISGSQTDKESENIAEELQERVVNLADITSFVNFMIKINQQYTMDLLKQVEVMKFIVRNELDLSQEELNKYEDDFNKQARQNLEAISQLDDDKLRELTGKEPSEITGEEFSQLLQNIDFNELTGEEQKSESDEDDVHNE